MKEVGLLFFFIYCCILCWCENKIVKDRVNYKYLEINSNVVINNKNVCMFLNSIKRVNIIIIYIFLNFVFVY